MRTKGIHSIHEGPRYLAIDVAMILAGALLVWAAPALCGEARSRSSRTTEFDRVPTIVTKGEPRVSGETLEWHFQIRNDSQQDIWICASMEGHCCEAHLAPDNKTLLIQRHLDQTAERLPSTQPIARYVRLRTHQTRAELLSLRIPIQAQRVFSSYRKTQGTTELATRVQLEIGYFTGNLPEMLLDMVHRAEMAPRTYPASVPPEKRDPSYYYFGGTTDGFLNLQNEGRGSKDRWVAIPYTWQSLKGEQVLRLSTDRVRIPYIEEERDVKYPDLTKCTLVEVKFETSAVESLFPYEGEQSLLSPAERQYLESLKDVAIRDPLVLRALAKEVRQGYPDAFVCEHGIAELACHSDGQYLMSLRMYRGSEIVTSNAEVIECRNPEGWRSLKRMTPQVQSLDLRMECASNLRDLWYRLRLYPRIKAAPSRGSPPGRIETFYPQPEKWCEALSDAYSRLGTAILKPFKCPSASEGRCHYAMNPNCTDDSAPDTILLFETRAGWNQHGGPELFTFDNHDPKGGLVLLNDGTVKFIRTEEELKQLRWK